jgi:hypothetical protein
MRCSVSRTSGPAMVMTPITSPSRFRTTADIALIPGAKVSTIMLNPRFRVSLRYVDSALPVVGALPLDHAERLFVRHGGEPGVTGSAARELDRQSHVRVVPQSPRRSLRLAHKGQAFAVQNAQAHQLTGLLGQPIQHGLGNVNNARVAQEAKAKRDQLHRQDVVTLFARLLDVAGLAQRSQQPMRGAERNVEPRRNG